MAKYFVKLLPCLIGMEAYGSPYYWPRKLTAMGQTAKPDNSVTRQAVRDCGKI